MHMTDEKFIMKELVCLFVCMIICFKNATVFKVEAKIRDIIKSNKDINHWNNIS